tara:strand:+ start:15321 stop:16610 length:1290 start_codon:yes stop_codon:yes gene_type:complete
MRENFEFLEEVANVKAFRLKSNQLMVLAMKDQTAPVVGFQITYMVGSRNETTGHTGATHLLEHLMFKGSKNYNKALGNNIDRMENIGAQLNATTSWDRTNYYMVLPKDNLEEIIKIEADRMRNAFIDEADKISEMPVVRNEFEQGENSPINAIFKQLLATVYQAHPYHHDTIGWLSDIENVSIERLKQFYHDFYWPDNAVLSVVGDFDEDDLLTKIYNSFGHIPQSDNPMPDIYTQEPEQEGERRFTLRRSAPGHSGLVCIAWKVPKGTDPEHMAIQVLGRALGDGKASRLHKALVDKGLALSASVFDHPTRDPGMLAVFVHLAVGVEHEKVESIVYEEIDKIEKNGLSNEELTRLRRSVKVTQAFAMDRISSRLSSLNESIAIGEWAYDLKYVERFNQVDSRAVQAVIRKYCDEDQRNVGYFIPKGEQ